MKARLSFKPNGSHLLSLSSPNYGDAASCRLQRRFGSSRFLYIDYIEPSHDDCSSLGTTRIDFHKNFFCEWLLEEFEFLGCRWRCFHLEEKESSNKSSGRQDGTHRLIFFAVAGLGLSKISLRSFFDDFLPFDLNLDQSFCKFYTRIGLSLSQAKPTTKFSVSEIRRVPDIFADGKLEATCFNDPAYQFPVYHDSTNPHIMSDGCGRLSPTAWRDICEQLGIVGTRPVAFQARINGAKGIWVLSQPYDSDSDNGERWIEVRDSQLKYQSRPRDSDLEVLKSSTPLKPAHLAIDFFPILQDRGVPLETISTVVEQQLDTDIGSLFETLNDPVDLRRWIAKIFGGEESYNREIATKCQGEPPSKSLEKVIALLENGFAPQSCPALAEWLQEIISTWALGMVQKLKIRLPKSTYVFGIPDIWGVLEPGEIHLAASAPFVDEESGESWLHLEGEVLVARHPTLRPNDIQKVRAVYKQELSFLKDVVVFPTKGELPLAAKLQGGDYDGDQFHICWDRRLVQPFRNAPAPAIAPSPQSRGIEVDRRSLRQVLGPSQDDIDNWLLQAFRFSMQDNLLGQTSNYLKRLSYIEESIISPGTTLICDIHDLIIDAAKNGYLFDQTSWRRILHTNRLSAELCLPAFEEFKKFKKADHSAIVQFFEKPKYKRKDARDVVCFEIAGPRYLALVQRMKDELVAGSTLNDEELEQYWKDAQKAAKGSNALTEALADLKENILALREYYASKTKTSFKDKFDAPRWKQIVASCIEKFRSLQPTKNNNDVLKAWTYKAGFECSRWELIRASALFHEFRSRTGHQRTKPAFLMAWNELLTIKACARQGARTITTPMYNILKTRKGKSRLFKGRVVSDSFEEEREDDDFLE